MPEAAELETLRRQIEPYLPSRVLTVSIWGDRTVRAHGEDLIKGLQGETFVGAVRRGKWLVLETASAGALAVHLRMSGRLHMTLPETPLEPHTHAAFSLSTPLGVRQLRFVDARTFGELRRVRSIADVTPSVPDVSELLTLPMLPRSFTTSRRQLKAVLLEQSALVQGVGNYLADEICFRARLQPTRVCSSLTVPEWQALLKVMPQAFEEFANLRGVALSDETWRDLDNVLGAGSKALQVHGKTVCTGCAKEVSKTKISGRSAYFCTVCQR